jgi:hypothetical protein
LEKSERLEGSSYETELAGILRFRPPLPCDKADISDIAAQITEVPEEPGYAWERLPSWLARVSETYKLIGRVPIITLDIGSSVPLYAQLLRSNEFVRDGRRAGDLSKTSMGSEAAQTLRRENAKLLPISHALSRDEPARNLLCAALQECLYEITPDEAARDQRHKRDGRFQQRFHAKLLGQKRYYVQEEQPEAGGRDVEVGWGLRIHSLEDAHSYAKRVQQLRIPNQGALEARERLAKSGGKDPADRELAKQTEAVGSKLADEYIAWQAKFISSFVVGDKRYKPARFLSMDASDPRQIALSGIANTPDTTKSLNLFSHAISSLSEPQLHIRDSLFGELPFPENSLALITCFDAWPFHFRTDEQLHGDTDFGDVILDTLMEFYDKLAFGGKIVIFPWTTKHERYKDEKADKKVLEGALLEFCQRVHHGVSRDLLPREVLREWMSVSDKETAETLSPIFKSNDPYFEALIINKPEKKSARARKASLGRSAIGQSLTQE